MADTEHNHMSSLAERARPVLADDGIKQAAAVARNRVSAVDVPAGFPVRGGAARLTDRRAERAAAGPAGDAAGAAA